MPLPLYRALTEMTESVEPRYGHVAAAVEQKLYLWGGMRRDWIAVHDGPAKTAITSVVDVLDLQVKITSIYF